MPTWLTIVLALGGSAVISTIIAKIFKHIDDRIAEAKEIKKKEEEYRIKAEERERQEAWENKVVDLIKPLDTKLDRLTDGTISSLRADMMLMRDRFRDQGFASGNDKAAWNQLYKDYASLGGNHFREYVDQWKEEINALPLAPDPAHDRRKNN